VTAEEWPRWGTSSPLSATMAAVVRELLERRRCARTERTLLEK
jgi:hypothetical protein